jgi:feruloyl-CoA synthase
MGVLSGSELFAPPRVSRTVRPDGSILLTAHAELGEYPPTVVHSLRRWAEIDPGRPLVARRGPDGQWVTWTYGKVVAAVDAVAQALLDRGLGPERPLLVLSGNSIEHFVVSFGAMAAGVPVVPTSVAYSLASKDHRRIREIADLVRPGAVFADDAVAYARALHALGDVPAIVGLDALRDTGPGPLPEPGSGAVAKILFTSGSTGSPKGVLNTHRMMSADQQAIRQVWPLLAERPVLVDWLPWSHTFGGNHNVNMVVVNGGTLYIDDGKPAPALIGTTIANLADVGPTIAFNVPAGWAQLLPALERDHAVAERFFARLRLMFNAAAALPEATRTRLETLAHTITGRRIPVTGAWGATETAPAVTSAHYDFEDARCIGVPLPGAEVKLVPEEGAYEIRVRGPMVTPGYLRRDDLTAAAFDDEGFYRTGDAVDFIDPDNPVAGLAFRGRIAEDFKLSNGTFVRVGALRTALLSAARILSDVVIVGEDRDFVCAMAWLNPAEAQDIDVAGHLAEALGELNGGAGSAGRIERLLLLSEPPDLDAGEITDKGYLNQRRILANRAQFVEQLYADPEAVITARSR